MQHDEKDLTLSASEVDLLRWVLPEDRPGYDEYFRMILEYDVIGTGRWGVGDYILGTRGDTVDLQGPMERVYAFGKIKYASGNCTISVHENVVGQIEVQFGLTSPPAKPSTEGIVSRFCYSYWKPGAPSPKAATAVREISIDDAGRFLLAVSSGDARLWLYDQLTGVNHLIPHMKFHNELMRTCGIKEKERVFNPKLIFDHPETFSDAQLREAFVSYNRQASKVELIEPAPPAEAKEQRLFHRLFKRKR